MYVSNVSFCNNFGTPIVLWSREKDVTFVRVHLALSGNLLFAQNTGFLGGAISLNNQHLVIILLPTLLQC